MLTVPVWTLQDRTLSNLRFAPAGAVETARAARLKDPEKVQDFLHARHQARSLVARETALQADAVELQVHDDARPGIKALPQAALSWSRSGPVALAAFSAHGRIGVDVERLLPVGYGPMLRMIATPDEERLVEAAAREDEKLVRFYRLWCAKEALLKWRGTGLRGGAKTMHVPHALITGEADEINIENNGLGVTINVLHTPADCVAVLAFSG